MDKAICVITTNTKGNVIDLKFFGESITQFMVFKQTLVSKNIDVVLNELSNLGFEQLADDLDQAVATSSTLVMFRSS